MEFNVNTEKIMTILLIEDDKTASEEIRKYVDNCNTVRLTGITNNSKDALELVKSTLPDAIILDLELHHGSGNGLQFLSEYSKLELSHRSYILVTTNNSSQITYETARTLGADFIMSKHEESYSAQSVIDFLIMIYPTLLAMRKHPDNPTAEITPSEKKKRLSQAISRELELVGISRKNIGFKYLLETILLTYEQPDADTGSILGQKYHKNEVSIERAMQYAINRAWKTAPIEDLQTYYTAKTHSCRGVPTLSEFIFYYVDLLREKEL